MEYIIKCDSYRLLKKKLDELTKNIDKENIFYYDMLNDNIKDILEECNYNSLFNEQKCVIIYNSYIFNNKFEYEEELNILEKYLDNPNLNTLLIFLADSVSITKKCVKLIDKKKGYINIKKLTEKELESSIISYLKENQYKIENKALDTLVKYQNENFDYILNELDKIMVIKKDYLITIEEIKKYSIDNREDNIFDFVDAILKRKFDEMSIYLNKYIKSKKEPSMLLSLIAGQYRFHYAVKVMHQNGLDNKAIAEKLNSKPYRIKMTLITLSEYTIEELKNKILFIGELDEKIKIGIIDKNIALKMLLFT